MRKIKEICLDAEGVLTDGCGLYSVITPTLWFSVSVVVCHFLLMPQRTLDSWLVSEDLGVGHSS